jgi:GNAT superfamily N-acetyltransferase
MAFAADPVMRWIWSTPLNYMAAWPRMVRYYGGQAFTCGSASYAQDYCGAALWLPPGVHPDQEPIVALIQSTVAAETQEELFAFFEKMGQYTPTEPYWYLPIIGVDPIHQGKGYGSALVRHGLLAADRDHLPAYLEASNLRNVALYEQCGFDVIGTIQVGSSPSVYPMYRKAR